MFNRNSLLLAAAVVALSATAASAQSGDRDYDRERTQSERIADQHSDYGTGYSNGYEDGYARRARSEGYRTDRYSQAVGYQRGDYYYGNDCNDNRVAGTVIGAIAGGVIGNQFGHGDGRTAATFGGVILGGIAGNAIAGDMNCEDRRYAFASYSSGFEGRIGQRHRWRNENGDGYGMFTPTREFARGGYTCRDFTAVTYRHGRATTRNGTACRQNDGNWYLQ